MAPIALDHTSVSWVLVPDYFVALLATHKLVNCQEVGLGQWVLNLEDLREVVNGSVSTFKCKTGLVLKSPSGVNTHGNALSLVLALGHGLDIFEVTNGPSKELYE